MKNLLQMILETDLYSRWQSNSSISLTQKTTKNLVQLYGIKLAVGQKMKVEIKDNSDKVEKELYKSLLVALEKCGLLAEGYAKKLCPVDTG